ncbi:sulfite reductase subunit alpha [Ottowia thiooxydans]|uniref:sulfite reductase subunit alpha n=1 Tax=Ottowia thiooxydans TaxID=219182 RepID=UPI00146D89ED|nr:sulfite reductase subunit alpha [Ottowia thiooxydans]
MRKKLGTWQPARGIARRLPTKEHAPSLLIGYASQSGFAALLAEDLARNLAAGGHPAHARSLHSLSALDISKADRMLFIVSTTGEGDAPDNAAAFVSRVMSGTLNLQQLRYGFLALGDSSYANFCRFGRELDAWLISAGAIPAFSRIEVDGARAAALDMWRQAVERFTDHTLAVDPLPSRQAVLAQRWVLVRREILNSGSPGAPIHHIVLRPKEPAVQWQAGDVARVWIPNNSDDMPMSRDYTLASLPQSGYAELMVREVLRPDGQRGLGSGWLGHGLAIGGELRMEIRYNREFHGPEATIPLILIGNGTGLAGLIAHLEARALAQQLGQPIGPAWLLFGERTCQFDALCSERLEGWLASGVLTRLNRAFSRDAEASAHYVQDFIGLYRDLLQHWVSHGAAVYVCGQREGMASGVDAALRQALGETLLEQLTIKGRYRRDVY